MEDQKYTLPDWDETQSTKPDIYDIPEIRDFKNLGSTLGPEGYLQLGVQRSRIARNETEALNDYTRRVLDGSIEREIKQKLDEGEQKLQAMIDQLGKAFVDPTTASMEDELDLEIRTMESMQPWTLAGLSETDLKALDPERLEMMKDPATGQFYTQEQWTKLVREAKRNKGNKLVDQGAKIDPYEAAASVIFQLIDPNSADVIASVPEKLRQQRFEMYRNQKVRDFESDQKLKMNKLQLLSSKYANLQDLYKDEMRRSDGWAAQIYKTEQDWNTLNFQVEQRKWTEAMDTANSILTNLQKLPPEQIKENLYRYNNLASYVNSIENKDVLKVYDDGDIANVYTEAKRKRTQETMKLVTDLILPMRMKWEMYKTDPDSNDLQFINQTLAAYGPQYIATEGVDRVLTINDLAILKAFNRPTANTVTQREKTASQERMNKDDNKTKQDIATQNNQTKKDIEASKPKPENKESKKWQDKLKQEEVKYNGLVAKYNDAIDKAKSTLGVTTLPSKFTPGQIFKLKNAGLYSQLFDAKSGLAAQIKESEAKMKEYMKNIDGATTTAPKSTPPKAGKGTGDLRRSESGNPPTTLKSGTKVKF
jgi:hypothetical protein